MTILILGEFFEDLLYLSDTFVEYFCNYTNYCTKALKKMVVMIKTTISTSFLEFFDELFLNKGGRESGVSKFEKWVFLAL